MKKEWNELFEDNKKGWNQRTGVHIKSDFYDVESFKKNIDSLNKIEKDILDGLKFNNGLHIQCHFGMDSISISKRYSVPVMGVDFSPEALNQASLLSSELQADCRFTEANILEMDQNLKSTYDLAFASYGTIGWFPDIQLWMEQVSKRINQGGHFLLVEFHPVMWMFDDDLQEIRFSYFNKEIITEEINGTYTDGGDDIQYTSHFWNHPLDDVIAAADKFGLKFRAFKEYDFTPYNIWSPMYPVEGGYRNEKLKDKLPYVYSLLCQKE